MEMSEVCSRCKRPKKIEGDTDTLVTKLKEQRDMKACITALEQYIGAIEVPLPAMMIITADKKVRVLEHLCTEPVGKFQGCAHRVATLISDVLGKK